MKLHIRGIQNRSEQVELEEKIVPTIGVQKLYRQIRMTITVARFSTSLLV